MDKIPIETLNIIVKNIRTTARPNEQKKIYTLDLDYYMMMLIDGYEIRNNLNLRHANCIKLN